MELRSPSARKAGIQARTLLSVPGPFRQNPTHPLTGDNNWPFRSGPQCAGPSLYNLLRGVYILYCDANFDNLFHPLNYFCETQSISSYTIHLKLLKQNSGSHIKTAPPNMSVPFTSIRFFNFNIQAPRLNLTRLV